MTDRQRRFEELPQPDPEDVQALAEDHPAVLQRLPLFEASVVSIADSPRIFVSGENNRKIGRVVTKGAWKGMPIYTLTLSERATCPTACHMYLSCYGNAMPFARRHEHGEALEEQIPKELTTLSLKHPRGYVIRLHILGDFYSETYARLWQDMLDVHDALRIYGYTALGESEDEPDLATLAVLEEMNADFSERCNIRMSSPESFPGGATVIDRLPEGANVTEGLVCPAEREATACCATCGLCWEQAAREKTIVFIKHGMGSKKTERMAREASKVDAKGIRRIEPLSGLVKVSGSPSNVPPTLLWIDPTDLYVDEGYQRGLARSSINLISRIVRNWNWTHFKPPIVVSDPDTKSFYILDGQHTAIAAATHDGVDKIPVMVVNAAHVPDRARAFISHNRDRVAVSTLQLHHSSVTANDPEAVAVDEICRSAGVTLIKQPPPQGRYAPGETMAVNTIKALMRRLGSEKTGIALACMVGARRAPLRADEMKAVAHLLYSDTGALTPQAVDAVVASVSYDEILSEAREIAIGSHLSMTTAMATAYAKRVRAYVETEASDPEELREVRDGVLHEL